MRGSSTRTTEDEIGRKKKCTDEQIIAALKEVEAGAKATREYLASRSN